MSKYHQHSTNYTPEQFERINRLAAIHHTSASAIVRNMLDRLVKIERKVASNDAAHVNHE